SSIVASAAIVSAHGIVSDLKIGGEFYGGYNPFQDPYMKPAPQRIVRPFPYAGNGPVEDLLSADIVCNKGAQSAPAPVSATVAAGSDITFFWTAWPESHRGPTMTYLAPCNGPCSEVTAAQDLEWFKIDHAGLLDDGTFISDKIIADNSTYTVTLPSDIAAGEYMIRHELLALHNAGNMNGAQFYPMCANLVITGGGSAKPTGVKFPGAYQPTDTGILVSIYGTLSTYTIPGPAVYVSGGSSAPEEPKTPVSTTSAAPTSTAAPMTTSIPVVTSAPEPLPEEPATTSALAVPTTTFA
ncbi:glycosyl hydrolase family 61-domain-containing protein, partial [Kalaharituber pfeilii]